MNKSTRILGYIIWCPVLEKEVTVKKWEMWDRSESGEYETSVNIKYEFSCECGEVHEYVDEGYQ